MAVADGNVCPCPWKGSGMKWLLVFLALYAISVTAGDPIPRINVELRKSEDSASVSSALPTMVCITSKSGIGAARIVRAEPQWPARLVIRLDLKGLESFKIDNGAIRVDASIKGPAKTPYWKIDKNTTSVEQPDGNLELAVTQSVGHIYVIVPKEMTKGNPEVLNIAWIDFFR